MKKEEVELVIIGLNMGEEKILHMKIYKDGTLCRSGCGGMPTFPITGMTVEGTKEYWNVLMSFIDDELVEQSINYKDEKIISPLEYFIAFYGASDNQETGERAKWTKTSGVRFLLDNNTSFRHPILGFLDGFIIKAAEITNEWFFDIVMQAVYNLQPINLENTIVTVPKKEEERQESLSRYVNQVMANESIGWDIVKIGNGRKYKTKEGKELTSSVVNNNGRISINFSEIFGIDDIEAANKRVMEMLNKENHTSIPNEKIGEDQKTTSTKSQKKSSKKWWQFGK